MTGERLFAILMICSVSLAQNPLGSYDIDTDDITMSGFSAGATMASQMHVAFSSKIKGLAMFAGSPYWCFGVEEADYCTLSPEYIDVEALVTQTSTYESQGLIDPTSNMEHTKVYLFYGTQDKTVVHGMLQPVEQYYSHYVNSTNLMVVGDVDAGHAMITSHYGVACPASEYPWINNCSYPAAYEHLNFFYGNIQNPVYGISLPGEWYLYDQAEFVDGGNAEGIDLDSAGWIYIPTQCTQTYRKMHEGEMFQQCKLHVHLHGCLQGRVYWEDLYISNIGYKEVGELNNIIIMYPQAIPSQVNEFGCWDWWGYTNENYATKIGPQMRAICLMIERVTGGTGAPCPAA